MIENKLKKIFYETIDSDREYKGNLKCLVCSDLIKSAINTKKNFEYETNNLCMFKYRFCDRDAVLMIFEMKIKSEEDIRNVNERFFDLLGDIEQEFVTLDYRELKEFEKDEYIYFICIKVIENEEDDYI